MGRSTQHISLEKTKLKWQIRAYIESYSHSLDAREFEKWNEETGKTLDAPLLFEKTADREFVMAFQLPENLNRSDPYVKASMVAISWLFGLNVASFGHIWWRSGVWPVRFDIRDIQKDAHATTRFVSHEKREWGKKPLTKDLLQHAGLIFGMTTTLDEKFFEFYSIAMTLLSSPMIEHAFYQEIFANFYKIIERFVALHVLKTGKLEDVQLGKLLEIYGGIGANADILDEVKAAYILRSSTVMHSLGKDRPVTFEEAGKCKALADLLLNKYLTKWAQEKLPAE